MLNVQLTEVNNGFILDVRIMLHEHQMGGGMPISFEEQMKKGAELMMKEINKDSVLKEIEDKNKEEKNNFVGTHVFKTYDEVIVFLKLLKD